MEKVLDLWASGIQSHCRVFISYLSHFGKAVFSLTSSCIPPVGKINSSAIPPGYLYCTALQPSGWRPLKVKCKSIFIDPFGNQAYIYIPTVRE